LGFDLIAYDTSPFGLSCEPLNQLITMENENKVEVSTASLLWKMRIRWRDRRMLVLNRKIGEVIVVNNNIRVIVVGIMGDKVRLGIDAPKEMTVHRKEVFDAIQREKEHED
jgi:carbon storage regulator